MISNEIKIRARDEINSILKYSNSKESINILREKLIKKKK